MVHKYVYTWVDILIYGRKNLDDKLLLGQPSTSHTDDHHAEVNALIK